MMHKKLWHEINNIKKKLTLAHSDLDDVGRNNVGGFYWCGIHSPYIFSIKEILKPIRERFDKIEEKLDLLEKHLNIEIEDIKIIPKKYIRRSK
jgi:hypothetical protein